MTEATADRARSQDRPAPAVFAGEKAARQREEGEEGDTEALAGGEDALLGLAVEEAVLVLHAHEARGAGFPGDRLGLVSRRAYCGSSEGGAFWMIITRSVKWSDR